MNRLAWILGLTLALILGLESCSESNHVVSKSGIQKRKHRKGYFVNVGVRKTQHATVRLLEWNTVPAGNRSTMLWASAAPEVDPRLLDRTLMKPLSKRVNVTHERSAQPYGARMTVTAQTPRIGAAYRSSARVALEEDEPEEDPTKHGLSLAAKVFAAASSFLLVAGVSMVVLMIVGTFTLSTVAVWILGGMVAAGILAILLSLLFSYIVYERYDDTDPMQWTLFASYIVEAILAIGTYLFFSFLPLI